MKEFLKRYKIQLEILTPVHIGNGRSMSKKEYIYYRNNQMVWIPDMKKLFGDIGKRHLEKEFERYMLSGNEPLLNWMKSVGYKDKEIQFLCAYCMDCSDALENLNRPLGIQEFVKDVYELPYIPGSSLKGAIRTALLAERLRKAPERYKTVRQEVLECETRVNGKPNTKYLTLQGKKVEMLTFHTLDLTERKQDALNDELKGIIISDSLPLSKKDLVLCQKIDMDTEHHKNSLNILRECLRPGTKAEFELTIDTSVCNITDTEIENALMNFSRSYRNVFVKKFMKIAENEKCNLYLGGGCGFATKTVLYELMGERQGLLTASKLMDLKFKKHGHRKDVEKGISPHMLKCTHYDKKVCEMGKCHVKIMEL